LRERDPSSTFGRICTYPETSIKRRNGKPEKSNWKIAINKINRKS
jgi:hypothetical protein